MKKNSFLEGAAVATLAIIFSRIIGLLYVIPFYGLVGAQGGALYSYGYSIYVIFLSLSSSGIPVAISKIVSEYTTLDQNWTKERVYKIGSLLIFTLSLVFFLILMIFAESIAYQIIGNSTGGNSIEDITYVIRAISLALLIVPFLSVTKGYLQGQKYIGIASFSNVIEQVVRVSIILIGSFFALKVFKLELVSVIGITMYAATIGAVVAYLYLLNKIKKHSFTMNRNSTQTREEITHNDSFLAKKILKYAVPLVVIDLVKNLTGIVDTFTYVRTLSDLQYPILEVERAFGTIATWASKLNMIVISIVIGISVSLIPTLVSSNIRKDKADISKKINQSLQVLLFLTLPMALGLYFLAQPVWVMFYGYDALSIGIFKLFVFQTLTFSFFSILIDSMQALNNIKHAFIGLLIYFFGKLILNVPMIYLLHYIGIDAYYGATVATLLTQLIAVSYLIYILYSKYEVRYGDTIRKTYKILLSLLVMMTSLYLLNTIYPVNAINRVDALFEILVYGIVGASTYIGMSFITKSINDIFGNRILDIILIKLKIKKA
jgi:O-antigen/teichoic acid export membrane protein